MEAAELVFNVIDNLNEPVLLLQKSEENIWSYSYFNQLMGKCLNIKGEESQSDDKALMVVPEGEIAQLIKQYEELKLRMEKTDFGQLMNTAGFVIFS